MEIIDGCLWITYTNDPENPVNIGSLTIEQAGTEGLEYYLLPDGTYGVKAGTTMYLEEIEIPAIYNGKPVTQILPNAFANASNLVSISMPASITTIEEFAFRYCTNLSNITLTNDIISIGAYAFQGCTSLTSFTVPDSVTSIGSHAFISCTELKTINIGDGVAIIEENVFYDCTSLTDIYYASTVENWGIIDKDPKWDFRMGDYIVYCTDGYCKDGRTYSNVIAAMIWDSLTKSTGEAVFSSNYDYLIWDGMIYIDGSVATLDVCGWVAYFTESEGTVGFQIDGGNVVYNPAFTYTAEAGVQAYITSNCPGALSACRMQFSIPVISLMSGEHTIALIAKDPTGKEEIIKEFTVTKTGGASFVINGAEIAEDLCDHGVGIGLAQTSADGSYVTITTYYSDPYYNVFYYQDYVANFIAIKYRTTSTTCAMSEMFVGSEGGPDGNGDHIKFNLICDGKWHLAIIDLSQASKVVDGLIRYLRWDMFTDYADAPIDLGYIAAFTTIEEAEAFDAAFSDVYIDIYDLSQVQVVTEPQEYVAYKMFVYQSKNGYGEFVCGGIDQNRYLITSKDISKALDIYTEENANGFSFYTTIDGAKKYINVTKNDAGKIAILYQDTCLSVYTYHADIHAWVTTIEGEKSPFWLGAYNTYDTVSASKIIFINTENTGVSQFPLQLVDLGNGNVTDKSVINIGTAEELITWANTIIEDGTEYSEIIINFTADIDMSGYNWIPLDGAYLDCVTFEGNGHTISNLTIEGTDNPIPDAIHDFAFGFGFIQNAEYNLTFQNLTFDKVNITAWERHVGVFVGNVYGDARLTFENCHVSNFNLAGWVDSNNQDKQNGGHSISFRVAGFVGGMFAGTIEFTDCTVKEGSMSGWHNLAAFVGYDATGNLDADCFTNCRAENIEMTFSYFLSDAYRPDDSRKFVSVFYNANDWVDNIGDVNEAGNTYNGIYFIDYANQTVYEPDNFRSWTYEEAHS